MTAINNTQRGSRSSSPAPTTTTETSGSDNTSQTSATNEGDLDGVEDIEMSMEPTSIDGMTHTTEPTPSAGADKAVAVAKEALSGMYVSDGDVDKVVTALEKLPPGEARAALETMKKDTTLSTLLEQADGDERRRLTDVLMSTGTVGSTTPQVPAVRSTKSPQPPTPPTLPVPPKDASSELRAMLHDENVARAKGYREEHQAYTQTYRDTIRHAKDFKELRQIGEISEPSLPAFEPGTTSKQDQTEWSKQATRRPDTETASVVTAKLYTLRGKVPPGGDANLSGAVKLGFGDNTIAEIGGSAGKDRYGATTSSKTIGADVALGPDGALLKTTIGTTQTTDADGKTTTTSGVKGAVGGTRKRDEKDVAGQEIKDGIDVSIDPENKSTKVSVASGKNKVAVGAGEKGVSARLENAILSGELTIEKEKQSIGIEAAGAKLGIDGSAEKITATIGAHGVTFTGGIDKNGGVITNVDVERKLELGDASIEIKVAWNQTIQLASFDDYRSFVAVVDGGVFETPPELTNGRKWSQLSDGAKAAYELFGWNALEWDTARKDSALRVAMFSGGR